MNGQELIQALAIKLGVNVNSVSSDDKVKEKIIEIKMECGEAIQEELDLIGLSIPSNLNLDMKQVRLEAYEFMRSDKLESLLFGEIRFGIKEGEIDTLDQVSNIVECYKNCLEHYKRANLRINPLLELLQGV